MRLGSISFICALGKLAKFMTKRTDIQSILIVGAGTQDSHYLFEKFAGMMG
jgi:hypothetical protein